MPIGRGVAGFRKSLIVQNHLDELKGTEGEKIRAMALSFEGRDPYTAGHQRRVSKLAGAIAREMGASDNDFKGICLAAAIHDIGKSSVPVGILNKSGPLTEFELSIVKGHPQSGHDMLQGIEFPWPIAKIVLQHHEMLDGSGYPRGLRGSQIMLQSRIVTVADVFEAMIADRPYRPRFSIGEALAHLIENQGRLYDERAVDACIWLLNIKGFRLD